MADDRMDFWWDGKTKTYIEGTPQGPVQEKKPMEFTPTTTVKTMDDVGTRFIHLADFQDYLSDGLLAVTNSLARYANTTDIERKAALESALKLLANYQFVVAKYDQQKWDFNNTLDANAPAKGVLDAIKADRITIAENQKAEAIKKLQGLGGQQLLLPGSDPQADGDSTQPA